MPATTRTLRRTPLWPPALPVGAGRAIARIRR